ncbi:putative adhesin [Phytophthora infestans]|uniref:Putative adhesin n=1 Tax=Phytophthora infestans TaxID=4787 RepID=A0A833S7K2_PHYIN|nr:putative adhesin [Phytophthora infestans]
MVAIGSCFGFALLGGLCILFTSDVELEVAAFLDKSLVLRDIENREKLLKKTKKILELAAVVLIVNAVAHLCFSWYLRRVVGERRAAVAFLQIFSVIMFPLSLFLILGGNYIVDTGTLASAPYAGLAIFSSGMLLLIVALLAFIGGNFEYRRLLSICYLMSALIGACLVVLAITCFAGRSFVEDNILDNWESIRMLLPPTSQVAYDRERFAAVMRSNLNTVAYVGLLSGVFVLSEAGTSLTLMRHASSWKHQLARAKRSMKDLQQTAVDLEPIEPSTNISQPESPLSFLQQWIKHFETSTRRQRVAMRVVIVFIVLAVMFILAVMCANVVFVAKCSSIGTQIASASFPLVNSSSEGTTNVIRLQNSFSRGEIIVSPANSTEANVDFKFYSSNGGSVEASSMYEKVVKNDTVSINLWPVGASQFLWLDGSCQRSMVGIVLPQEPLQRVVVNTNTSVVVKGSDSLKLQGLSVTTMQSSVLCSNVEIRGAELLLETTSGDISVDSMTIDASNTSTAESPARVYSELGLVSISNVVLSQCDLQVETGASSLTLSDVHSSVNTGRSHIEAKSSSASIAVDDIHANWITLKSGTGDIYGAEILIEGNSAFMGRLEVTTVSGDIELKEITASGTVHIESASGAISVQLNTQTFAGMYFMRSESGSMSIRHTNYSDDVIVEAEDSVDGLEKHGSINCDPATNNCLAFGSLYLRSNFGDVEIVLGCNSYSCSELAT